MTYTYTETDEKKIAAMRVRVGTISHFSIKINNIQDIKINNRKMRFHGKILKIIDLYEENNANYKNRSHFSTITNDTDPLSN